MEAIDSSEINLFKKYLEENEDSIENSMHIPYLIGSPLKLFKDGTYSKKNDALLPVVVLIKKKDKTSELKEFLFNWHSIDLIKTYSKINRDGQLEYLENDENYQKFFNINRKIIVDISNVKEMKLVDIINKYGFYRKLSNNYLNKYKDENFLIFKSNEITYVVPVIEVIRFFYCYSSSDSLKLAIFHPSGINHLVKKCEKNENSNKYDLYLQSICELVDKKKVFYFSHDEYYSKCFNSIYHNLISENILKAIFPFYTAFSMTCNVLELEKNSNVKLVTQILSSNMTNTFYKRIGKLHVHHPLAQEQAPKTGKRDPSKNNYKKIPKNRPNDFDDSLGTSASLPIQRVTNSDDIDDFPEEEDTSINEILGQREEKGGKNIFVEVEVDNNSTIGGQGNEANKSQKIETSNYKRKITEYPNAKEVESSDINNIEKLLIQLKLKGFDLVNSNTYEFPDKSNGEKRVISYLDNELKIKRKYNITIFSKNENKYIYVDPEKDKYAKPKEILILINKNIDIAHKCIYHQVYYGNHRWMSKEFTKLEKATDYITVPHRGSVEDIVNKIKNELKV
jgi:hypothetical protein